MRVTCGLWAGDTPSRKGLRQEELLAGGKRLHQRDHVGPDALRRIACLRGAGFPQRVEILPALGAGGAVALHEKRRGRGEIPGGGGPHEIRDLFPPVPFDLIPVLAHLIRILERRGPDEHIQSFADLGRDRVRGRRVPAPLLRHVHEEHRKGDRPHRAGRQGPRLKRRPPAQSCAGGFPTACTSPWRWPKKREWSPPTGRFTKPLPGRRRDGISSGSGR